MKIKITVKCEIDEDGPPYRIIFKRHHVWVLFLYCYLYKGLLLEKDNLNPFMASNSFVFLIVNTI